MSPRDRRRWRLLQNDRRELLAYKEALCQSLQRAYEMPLKLLEEIERVDKAIRENEEACAEVVIKSESELNGGRVVSPCDRPQWRKLQNDRRELIAYRETLYKLLRSADETLDTLLEEIDEVDESIKEDEEALAALAIKYGLA